MKYFVLVITYFCSSYITEEEINNLKRLCLCRLVVLLRGVTIHIWNRLWDLAFLKIRKRSSLCGFDFEGNPEKGWGNGKKVPMSRKQNLCTSVLERKKQLWNFCNHFKLYKKCKSLLFKTNFKIAELLTKNILFSLLQRPS